MMQNISVPSWMLWLFGGLIVAFFVFGFISVRRVGGIKRSYFASPYTVWMVLFTLLPCILIAYYALHRRKRAFYAGQLQKLLGQQLFRQ
jgi:Zn-dependent protease with chaperone function